jgi:hypothetical protein
MSLADEHDMAAHLLVDLLWKAGIVVVLVVAVVLACVLIARRAGR